MRKILLIDDDETSRDALARRLLRKGFKVDASAEGDEGLQLAADTPPDLVVVGMNLVMPDGWDVTRRLKSQPSTRDVPVIALLDEDTLDQREKAVDAGCDDYQAKPIHVEQMVERIQQLLQRRTAP